MNPESRISLDDFKKVEIKVGKILSVEKIPDTEKLLRLSVDFGLKPTPTEVVGVGSPDPSGLGLKSAPAATAEAGSLSLRDIRQIISGIALYFGDPQVLVNKKCMFVTNLEPRVIKGFESNGMLFAVSTEAGAFSFLEPTGDIPEGTTAR